MLTLTAEIGAQMEVTFEKAFRCVVTQQRINGCAGYLSVDSKRARAGDKCRVTLVAYAPGPNIYYVRVDEVIKHGDGVTSLLEKTLCQIQVGPRRGEQNFEQNVLARLRARCDGDADMLEVLLDVLQSYSFNVEQRSALLNYGHYCIVVARLINKLYADDAQARAAMYRRAAQYCEGKEQGQKWADAFVSVAGSI